MSFDVHDNHSLTLQLQEEGKKKKETAVAFIIFFFAFPLQGIQLHASHATLTVRTRDVLDV